MESLKFVYVPHNVDAATKFEKFSRMRYSVKLRDFCSYFSFVLVKFYKLVIHLYGGKRQVEIALKGERVIPANYFPCCFVCCCRNQPMTV